MGRRTFLVSAALAPLALSLGGCGEDRWTDYSYKMTIWVGDKPFSTVRHVRVEEGSTIQDSSGRRVDRLVHGEAIIIDTSTGPIFALMKPAKGDFGNGYYAAYIAQAALVPAINKPLEYDADQAVREYSEQQQSFDQLADDAATHNAMLKVQGPRDLPREIPYSNDNHGRTIPIWPMFVRFGDTHDSKSVQEVSSDSLGISRITIEVKAEDISRRIQKTLPWLSRYPEPSLNPAHGPRDYSLPAILHHGDFIQGLTS